jgi:hypothetical protein
MPGSTIHLLAIAPLALLIASTGLAQTGNTQTSHQHGHGLLQVAIENNTLELLFRAPAASLTGFEHAPRNDEQRELVQNTLEWLEQTPLASFSGHTCEVGEVSILGNQPEHDHDTHSHNHDHGATHSEYEVSQSIQCDGHSDRLHSPLTEKFRHLEILQVEWVSPAGQGSGELGQDRSELPIGQD